MSESIPITSHPTKKIDNDDWILKVQGAIHAGEVGWGGMGGKGEEVDKTGWSVYLEMR